jgi:hypothetical protein
LEGHKLFFLHFLIILRHLLPQKNAEMTLAAHRQHNEGQRYLAEDGSPLQVGLSAKTFKGRIAHC